MSDKKVGAGFGVLVLNKEGKALLGLRHEDAEKASSDLRGEGTWTMPGGKMDFGETFEEGARREVMEETGLKLNSIEVICVNNNMNEHAHYVTIGLFSDDFEGEPQVLEPDEITRWEWFGLDEFPENMYFPSSRLAENYRQKKFYIEKQGV